MGRKHEIGIRNCGMIRLIDRHPWLLFVILIAVYLIAGTMDYADAKFQEKTICQRHPEKEFCTHD